MEYKYNRLNLLEEVTVQLSVRRYEGERSRRQRKDRLRLCGQRGLQSRGRPARVRPGDSRRRAFHVGRHPLCLDRPVGQHPRVDRRKREYCAAE